MTSFAPFKNPLCVALDVDTLEQAISLAEKLSSVAGGFKVGPRLIHRYGPQIVEQLKVFAPVFVDCKFFDIPSTMVAAVQASFDAGASVVTVHALCGREALFQLAQLEKDLQKIRPFRILAVTILTSWNESSFPSNFQKLPVHQHVRQLAELVQSSGLNSIVCSPEEISLVKDLGLFLLTPGIRLPQDSADDQKRIMGPQQALQAGASVLVVGRPIIAAKDPLAAARMFFP